MDKTLKSVKLYRGENKLWTGTPNPMRFATIRKCRGIERGLVVGLIVALAACLAGGIVVLAGGLLIGAMLVIAARAGAETYARDAARHWYGVTNMRTIHRWCDESGKVFEQSVPHGRVSTTRIRFYQDADAITLNNAWWPWPLLTLDGLDNEAIPYSLIRQHTIRPRRVRMRLVNSRSRSRK